MMIKSVARGTTVFIILIVTIVAGGIHNVLDNSLMVC